MEENAKKYEQKLEHAYNDLNKTHIRPMMKKTYQCSADCCERVEGTYEDVQRCVDNCGSTLTQAQTYLKDEFQDFQNRVQRCLMVCNDNVKSKMEKNGAKSFSNEYRADYESCAIGCLQYHGDQIQTVLKKVKNTLDSHTKVIQ